ncbi:hypothetical protein [Acinetobacter guillouiae]|uniref:hypothetical protein n=1 Tax=Acinetobacter guillouiae TaxID=106649 RepID=UPI00333EB655
MSIQYLPIFWSEYPMTCSYIDELYVVVYRVATWMSPYVCRNTGGIGRTPRPT